MEANLGRGWIKLCAKTARAGRGERRYVFNFMLIFSERGENSSSAAACRSDRHVREIDSDLRGITMCDLHFRNRECGHGAQRARHTGESRSLGRERTRGWVPEDSADAALPGI